jgi:hypothetical protein
MDLAESIDLLWRLDETKDDLREIYLTRFVYIKEMTGRKKRLII